MFPVHVVRHDGCTRCSGPPGAVLIFRTTMWYLAIPLVHLSSKLHCFFGES